MNISIFETIAVSENISQIKPGLCQLVSGFVAGRTYRLTFNADISSGVLKVYQGSQKIFDTSSLPGDTTNDIIHVTEHISLDRRSRVSLFDSVTVSEGITIVRI